MTLLMQSCDPRSTSCHPPAVRARQLLSWLRFELNASAFRPCITFLMFTFYNVLSAVGLCSLSGITACPYYDYKDMDHII